MWGMPGCSRVCSGVPAWVYLGVPGCMLVYVGVQGCLRVCACVWDEFSEFLPETRVLTSADFNIYPIQILLSLLDNAPMWVHYLKENVQCILYTFWYYR